MPLAWLVEVPLVNGAEGTHGPVFLPAESGLGEELSEPGIIIFLGEFCADAGVGGMQIINAAISPANVVARKNRFCLWMFIFIGNLLW